MAKIEMQQMCEIEIIHFQFRQLFYNLISNSLKFSKPNTPSIIKISSQIKLGEEFEEQKLEKGRKYCHIKVSDNGIGFDTKYKEKMFEVFQQLHTKNRFKGTGIGLAIVKKIVENHNGFISADGSIDNGANFDIYIPAQPLK